ncbi:hypothetical protein DIPPA_06377 [Diplonema papillatum]|nr:hypothetical protein DIPPA_06377 [Diplonema papillatum]
MLALDDPGSPARVRERLASMSDSHNRVNRLEQKLREKDAKIEKLVATIEELERDKQSVDGGLVNEKAEEIIRATVKEQIQLDKLAAQQGKESLGASKAGSARRKRDARKRAKQEVSALCAAREASAMRAEDVVGLMEDYMTNLFNDHLAASIARATASSLQPAVHSPRHSNACEEAVQYQISPPTKHPLVSPDDHLVEAKLDSVLLTVGPATMDLRSCCRSTFRDLRYLYETTLIQVWTLFASSTSSPTTRQKDEAFKNMTRTLTRGKQLCIDAWRDINKCSLEIVKSLRLPAGSPTLKSSCEANAHMESGLEVQRVEYADACVSASIEDPNHLRDIQALKERARRVNEFEERGRLLEGKLEMAQRTTTDLAGKALDLHNALWSASQILTSHRIKLLTPSGDKMVDPMKEFGRAPRGKDGLNSSSKSPRVAPPDERARIFEENAGPFVKADQLLLKELVSAVLERTGSIPIAIKPPGDVTPSQLVGSPVQRRRSSCSNPGKGSFTTGGLPHILGSPHSASRPAKSPKREATPQNAEAGGDGSEPPAVVVDVPKPDGGDGAGAPTANRRQPRAAKPHLLQFAGDASPPASAQVPTLSPASKSGLQSLAPLPDPFVPAPPIPALRDSDKPA